MKKVTKLSFIPELVGAVGDSLMTEEQAEQFRADPLSFLDEMNLSPDGAIDVQVCENTEDEVHIALPYYDGVEDISASSVSDDSIESVSGGEILGLLIVAAIGGGILAGATYGIAKEQALAGRDEAFKEITGQDFPNQGK